MTEYVCDQNITELQLSNIDDYHKAVLYLLYKLQWYLSQRGLCPEPEEAEIDETTGRPVRNIQVPAQTRRDWPREGLYTESADYLLYSTIFHLNERIHELFANVIGGSVPVNMRVIDVGCSAGFTGLTMALAGWQDITFHDFEGLAGDFLRWIIDDLNLSGCQFIPYGQEHKRRYDYVIALDVMEHVGNHLLFLEWLQRLGDRVILTYPLMPYHPPYQEEIDEWIDDEAISMIIASRYNVLMTVLDKGRRFAYYQVAPDEAKRAMRL